MAITNPFKITYGDETVGGSTDYALHGPYVIEKQFDSLRLVFDVVVTATSYSELQEKSDTIEIAFAKRSSEGDTLEIDLDGNSWTYTHGSTMLNAQASITKSANSDTDKGFSRAYTVSVAAELPATDDAGLRDIEVLVEHTPSRQKIVTMRGTYTAVNETDAVEQYKDEFDDEADLYLTAADADATFELVDETYTMDRNRSGATPFTHVCNFTRQYVELLVNQTQADLDAAAVRDHRVAFTDLSQHPGDSQKDIRRLRRVVGNYDCAVDIDESTDAQKVYKDTIKPHVRQLFEQNFSPKVFAVEEERVSYDETAKRMSVSLQFIYQTEDSDSIIEVSQSVAFKESRTLDYTPTHAANELAAHVDVGFMTLERVWIRTVVALGTDQPRLRIAVESNPGDAGKWDDELGGNKGPDARSRKVSRGGWNIIDNTSQITPQWIGDPETGEQIAVVTLTETVIERYNVEPGANTAVAIRRNPITPRN